jgi:hypothetical protein
VLVAGPPKVVPPHAHNPSVIQCADGIGYFPVTSQGEMERIKKSQPGLPNIINSRAGNIQRNIIDSRSCNKTGIDFFAK